MKLVNARHGLMLIELLLSKKLKIKHAREKLMRLCVDLQDEVALMTRRRTIVRKAFEAPGSRCNQFDSKENKIAAGPLKKEPQLYTQFEKEAVEVDKIVERARKADKKIRKALT